MEYCPCAVSSIHLVTDPSRMDLVRENRTAGNFSSICLRTVAEFGVSAYGRRNSIFGRSAYLCSIICLQLMSTSEETLNPVNLGIYAETPLRSYADSQQRCEVFCVRLWKLQKKKICFGAENSKMMFFQLSHVLISRKWIGFFFF